LNNKNIVLEIDKNGPNSQFDDNTFKYYLAITSFDFLFILLLMNKDMRATNFIFQTFQRKNQDIVNVLNFVLHAKFQL
jgi:hypothetical protein